MVQLLELLLHHLNQIVITKIIFAQFSLVLIYLSFYIQKKLLDIRSQPIIGEHFKDIQYSHTSNGCGKNCQINGCSYPRETKQ